MSAQRPLALATLVVAVTATVASAASVTEICKLPRPGNNGKVLGHDVGWSTLHGGASWFFFGDTYVDENANGVWDGVFVDRFVPGTILARTTDTNPNDCLDLTYKVDGSGDATPLIPTNANETYVWPGGAISLGSKFYTYYGSYKSFEPVCESNGFCRQSSDAVCPARRCPTGPTDPPCDKYLVYRGSGLARIDVGSNVSTTTATRIGGYFFSPTELDYGNPIRIVEQTLCGAVDFVYLFATRRLGCYGPSEVYLARVPPASIEDRSKYEFWGLQNGKKKWVTQTSLSTPIYTTDYASTFNVHYDTSAQRFLATYTCDFLSGRMCTVWAGPTGNRAAALTGAWIGFESYDCPGDDAWDCYQAYGHSQYQSGNVSYMTGARNHAGEYWVNLRKVDFGPGH